MHNFRVNIAILNPKDNFCNWYKLNFGPLPDQVKSCHFSERINARGQYFYWNDWLKMTLTILLDIDLDLLLPFEWNWISLGPG